MATSLGIIDSAAPQFPTLPALPAFPGVPGLQTYPTTVPLPSTPDGNVVAPPTVGAPPGTTVPPPPSGGLEAWIRGLSKDERDLLGGALIGVAVASGAAVLYWLSTQRKGSAPRGRPTRYVDGVYEDAPRGLRGGAETVYPESQPRGLLGPSRALLANPSKRPNRVPVYIRVPRGCRNQDKMHASLQRMGGKVVQQGGAGGGVNSVYLFPPSKVRAAIATAKRLGGRRTVAKADKRIKVLGGDLVKFPKGFKKNPASLPMFWVGSGKKRERKWVAV